MAHFPVPSFFQQVHPTPSCTSKPLSILFEPYFSIFLAFQAFTGLLLASSSLQRQLSSLAETCVCLGKASSSSPITFFLCLGPDIPGSSSTAVIRPPFRALFDPNVIQFQVKWIWRLKILFLHPHLWISYYHIGKIDW